MKTRRYGECVNELRYPRFSLEITTHTSPSIDRSEELPAQSYRGRWTRTSFVQSRCFEMSVSEIRGLLGINLIKIYPHDEVNKG